MLQAPRLCFYLHSGKTKMLKTPIIIFWFRRDLRLQDNVGLYHALKTGIHVLPIFIFDKNILTQLENKNDRRVDFIHKSILNINEELKSFDSSLKVFYSTASEAFQKLLQENKISAVYTNHDYEPSAIERDEAIQKLLSKNGIELKTFKDQCIFEKSEVTKDDGKPYTVFTPYSRKWKERLTEQNYKVHNSSKYFSSFIKTKPFFIPSLKDIGFNETDISIAKPKVSSALLKNYKAQRDFPAVAGTSRLSMCLRFGTVSIRALVKHALANSETWLNELIWREFYMAILWHFPHAAKGAFKKEYARIPWRNNEIEFEKWCKGETGFPIVDAGMRELNATGFMHNRVRMITASFLVKDLLIDWSWGEAYFAEKLNDFDLSANNGGWQWAAGSGCDAAPYFRIFNPDSQQQKFDPEFKYIKKWIPEFGTDKYPMPIVDHKLARIRTLTAYKKALSENK